MTEQIETPEGIEAFVTSTPPVAIPSYEHHAVALGVPGPDRGILILSMLMIFCRLAAGIEQMRQVSH